MVIYKIIINPLSDPRRCPRNQSLHGMPPRGPRCPVNRPPGVAGAWLLLQGSRRVSLEAGRARARGAEREDRAGCTSGEPPEEA